MMFEGKHIHFSPTDNKPLCSYSVKLCKQRRLKDYAFCIRHILEDKSAPFKQCSHVARYNNQKCINPIPCVENRQFCNSHMQVAGILPKSVKQGKKTKNSLPSNHSGLHSNYLPLLSNHSGLPSNHFPLPSNNSMLPSNHSTLPSNHDALPSNEKVKFADRLRALLRNGEDTVAMATVANDDPYAFTDAIETQPQFIKTEDNSVSTAVAMATSKPKFAKTMNRLQAKIAHNKLMDKLKKSQSSHYDDGCHDNGGKKLVNGNCHKMEGNNLVVMGTYIKQEPIDCVSDDDEDSVAMTTDKDERLMGSGVDAAFMVATVTKIKEEPGVERKCDRIRDELVKGVVRSRDAGRHRRRRKDDVFNYGCISSDSGDDADDFCTVQKLNWCSSLERNAATWCSTKATTRQGKQAALKSELRRLGNLAKKSLSIEECVLEHQLKMARNVVQATHIYPKYTAQLLCDTNNIKRKMSLEKSTCCFQSEGAACGCAHIALPYARHCAKHIMYNVDQLLFEHCTAKFADNTQCCIPVFDIAHELPLCAEHAKKRDNYNRMANEPKPKKVRKKAKPSSLTRSKRGKKKKRLLIRPISPTSPPTSPPPTIEPSTLLAPLEHHPMPSTCTTDNNTPSSSHHHQYNISNTAVTDNCGTTTTTTSNLNQIPKTSSSVAMETELAQLESHFSQDTMSKSLDLPLDTAELARQATKLLEEHDFTEVLNKIPDEAFSDLFNDGRNGEYIPTKEETDELERALAAVSKDVNLAKESLAKLTVTRQDIEELSSNIALPSALVSAENLTSTLTLHDIETTLELNSGHMTNFHSANHMNGDVPVVNGNAIVDFSDYLDPGNYGNADIMSLVDPNTSHWLLGNYGNGGFNSIQHLLRNSNSSVGVGGVGGVGGANSGVGGASELYRQTQDSKPIAQEGAS